MTETTRPDRRTRGGFRTLTEPNPGRRAGDMHALRAWHPAARVAVVAMIASLCAINIWMDAAIHINALPKLDVAVGQPKFG